MAYQVIISVVIPTYNRANQLDSCLHSLCKQNYPLRKYEVIVIDDNSNDMTPKVLGTYSEKYSNLIAIKTEENKGAYHSRNLGASISRGNVVAFTDSDCILPPDWLLKIDRAFKNREVMCVQGTFERKGKWELPVPGDEHLRHPSFQKRKGLDTKNLAIRKKLFLKYKFDEKFRNSGDQDLGHRLTEDRISISYNPDVTVTHVETRGFWELTSRGKKYGEGIAKIYKKRGWRGVSPKFKYPTPIVLLYYLGSFFYNLLRYQSFRGAIASAMISFWLVLYFKINVRDIK